MKAYLMHRYGGPQVLHLEEVDQPVARPGHLLVRVLANSVNPADWHVMRGSPIIARMAFGLFKPRNKFLGGDFAGVVEQVGQGLEGQYRVGDRVFGEALDQGTFREYINVKPSVCAIMPHGAPFAGMACLPIAGLTALQGLVTHGKLRPGESVLINGASGGVGHLAVQIAAALGARVTAVCSSRNADFVRSMGAHVVVPYDQEPLAEYSGKHHLVLDTHGNLAYADYLRLGHRGVAIGFTTLARMLALTMKKTFGRHPVVIFTAQPNTADLNTLAQMAEEGKLQPHIEKTYEFAELPAAIAHIEAMRTRGKVAVAHAV
jgi:NADPH:quinone reductase-like Zn-dependent oxidoreductase